MTKLRHLPPEEYLSRRVFLVGSTATGLVLGYSALPTLGIGSQALAAESFEPTVWYTISPDGIVTVICGKAEMGQHISSTIAQLIAEELGAGKPDALPLVNSWLDEDGLEMITLKPSVVTAIRSYAFSKTAQ